MCEVRGTCECSSKAKNKTDCGADALGGAVVGG